MFLTLCTSLLLCTHKIVVHKASYKGTSRLQPTWSCAAWIQWLPASLNANDMLDVLTDYNVVLGVSGPARHQHDGVVRGGGREAGGGERRRGEARAVHGGRRRAQAARAGERPAGGVTREEMVRNVTAFTYF